MINSNCQWLRNFILGYNSPGEKYRQGHRSKSDKHSHERLSFLVNEATSIFVLICNLTTLVAESVAVTVNVTDPADVGVPEITPVAEFRVNPAGNDPVVTAQVYGATPPVAVNVPV
jgi:hypothetical protein